MSTKFPSVSFLIPKLKSGDESAWAEVHSKFRIGLSSKARQLIRTTGTHKKKLSADDLVQETFLKVWRNRAAFRGDTSSQLSKWMLVTLKNTFLDVCRRKDLEKSIETWRELHAHSQTPSAIVSSVEQEAEFLNALEELSPDQQRVIAMRVFEGLSFPAIAEQTDMNLNTVSGIYRRGLLRVTKLLRPSSCYPQSIENKNE